MGGAGGALFPVPLRNLGKTFERPGGDCSVGEPTTDKTDDNRNPAPSESSKKTVGVFRQKGKGGRRRRSRGPHTPPGSAGPTLPQPLGGMIPASRRRPGSACTQSGTVTSQRGGNGCAQTEPCSEKPSLVGGPPLGAERNPWTHRKKHRTLRHFRAEGVQTSTTYQPVGGAGEHCRCAGRGAQRLWTPKAGGRDGPRAGRGKRALSGVDEGKKKQDRSYVRLNRDRRRKKV